MRLRTFSSLQARFRLSSKARSRKYARCCSWHFQAICAVACLQSWAFVVPGSLWSSFGRHGKLRELLRCKRWVATSDHVASKSGTFVEFPEGSAIALGKFDALHRGHAALADVAGGLGSAWLMSFDGMAEVLGWKPRLPLVAPELRSAVLEEWGGVQERSLPFAEIRSMEPEAFVNLLAGVLCANSVVCGSNYRFGYRASGDAALLKLLGEAAGLNVVVVDLVSSSLGSETAVSSTVVRESLAEGNVRKVSGLLGRPHAVVWRSCSGNRLSEPSNQPPGDGVYAVEVTALGQNIPAIHANLRIENQTATLDTSDFREGGVNMAGETLTVTAFQ
mmetsp:Transcript_9594/g.17210  ORF Transcript_9594/g.17210 Transcript_9594/m.17210 type:complete len:333 (-) Transcript_9594:61-1059(-)